VGIKAEDASQPFDYRQSVLRFELIDHWNRYLGTMAVPTYLLKIKKDSSSKSTSQEQRSSGKSAPKQNSKENQISMTKLNKSLKLQLPIQLKPEAYEVRNNIERDNNYRSMTDLHEIWANSQPRNSLLKFHYVRRTPLNNLSAIRILHNCYHRDAQIRLKFFIIYDDMKKEYYRVDLTGKPLKATHPCPPSRVQVFKLEKLASIEHLEELRPFSQSVGRTSQCCPFNV